ncbi:MAG: aminotransferase class I/II-fold pyridoxal phosphate-dependent enzyme [Pseudomonadota bacterium]
MALKVSNRSDVESFRALSILSEVAERKAKGEDIISLAPGQPCFGAPKAVLESAAANLNEDPIQGYTAAIGTLPLRERIAQYYKTKYAQDIAVDQVAVTPASSGGFILALMTAFEAGDTVALTVPTYPAYIRMLKSLDLNVVFIETTKESNYQPTPEILENAKEKFDGLMITSPSNPTGAMIDHDTLKGICGWCDDNGVRLISDEAYHGITYETPAQTALAFTNKAIILNTFSKYFALTGWRLGWMVIPEDMAPRVKALAENLFVSPPTIAQHVAYNVFDHLDVLDGYVAQYKTNRDILRERLPKIGFGDLSSAQGAFYFYIDVHSLTNNSEDFCRRMLDEAHVAMTPGNDFDPGRGSHTLRISYAGSAEDMNNACDRLEKWLG